VTRAVLPPEWFDSARDPEFFSFQTTHTGVYWVGSGYEQLWVFDGSGHLVTSGPNLVAFPVSRPGTTYYVGVSMASPASPPAYSLAIASFGFGQGPTVRTNLGSPAQPIVPTPAPATAVLVDPSMATGPVWARSWALGRPVQP
jgi:hypothetical protein